MKICALLKVFKHGAVSLCLTLYYYFKYKSSYFIRNFYFPLAPEWHYQETGDPFKIYRLTREGAKSLTVKLKKLQKYLTTTDYSLLVTATSCITHMFGQWLNGSSFTQKHPKPCVKKILWPDENNFKKYSSCKNFMLLQSAPTGVCLYIYWNI